MAFAGGNCSARGIGSSLQRVARRAEHERSRARREQTTAYAHDPEQAKARDEEQQEDKPAHQDLAFS
jgi:hypothetical protein